MTDNTTILIGAIVSLSGVVVYMFKVYIKEIKENTRALDKAREVLDRVEKLLTNWRGH
jgi:hypothetical protein